MQALRPRVRGDLTVTELDGESVIYDEIGGDLHHLNGPATLVLGLCDGTLTLDEMAEAIADAFDRPVAEVAAQLAELVAELRKAGIVDAVDDGAP